MSEEFDFDQDNDGPRYCRPNEINPHDFTDALRGLTFFDDDINLRVQAFNLAMVDQFITNLEYEVLSKLLEEEATPVPEASFLSAQSQMWIFGAYELLRTWRQRARSIIKWSENGGLEVKLKEYEKETGYRHYGRQFRAEQLKKVLADPSIIEDLKADLRKTHITFSRIEAVRIAIAKHEVRGRKNSVAFMPGYGRINNWCGSLDYELENGSYIMGYINRRNIADEIRAFATTDDPPTEEDLAEFDAFMRGPDAGAEPVF